MNFDILKEKIIEKLKDIYDPEIPVNIYDLGLIYSIDCEKKDDNSTSCIVSMTLTSAGCPVSEVLYDQVCNVSYIIDGEDDLDIIPKLVFDPPWTQDMMSDDAKLALGML
ncbi:iron-sulfur cluster assembly protein [Sulfurimonas sp.]|uniref:iron-sulfur cluster assembly protein n=1 Tax=Sulfurimonas sp. TaxID=2022749 RepID=UPI0039E31D6F